MYILVVEDEFLIALELKHNLLDRGHTVLGPVGSVSEGSALVKREIPDGALMDINLGDETSYDVALLLRERDVPVVFFTGYEDRVLPKDLQAIPRFVKPIDKKKLDAALDYLAAKR